MSRAEQTRLNRSCSERPSVCIYPNLDRDASHRNHQHAAYLVAQNLSQIKPFIQQLDDKTGFSLDTPTTGTSAVYIESVTSTSKPAKANSRGNSITITASPLNPDLARALEIGTSLVAFSTPSGADRLVPLYSWTPSDNLKKDAYLHPNSNPGFKTHIH